MWTLVLGQLLKFNNSLFKSNTSSVIFIHLFIKSFPEHPYVRVSLFLSSVKTLNTALHSRFLNARRNTIPVQAKLICTRSLQCQYLHINWPLIVTSSKMFHFSSLSSSPYFLCHFFLVLLLSCTLPPWASLSVSQTAMEKRREVNSLSPRLVNNVTRRLTEWVWMASAGRNWLEYFLNYRRHRCPLNPSSLTCLI